MGVFPIFFMVIGDLGFNVWQVNLLRHNGQSDIKQSVIAFQLKVFYGA